MAEIYSFGNFPERSGALKNNEIEELRARIAALENNIQQLLSLQPVCIEKLYVRKVEKLQLKLDSIDVEELSGMLNIGITSGGKLKKKEINKE